MDNARVRTDGDGQGTPDPLHGSSAHPSLAVVRPWSLVLVLGAWYWFLESVTGSWYWFLESWYWIQVLVSGVLVLVLGAWYWC